MHANTTRPPTEATETVKTETVRRLTPETTTVEQRISDATGDSARPIARQDYCDYSKDYEKEDYDGEEEKKYFDEELKGEEERCVD